MTDERRAGRLQLVLIGLVFIGPLIASFVVYFGGIWKPENSSIHGELLQTPISLPDDPFSADIQTSRLRDKWSLIHVIDGACETTCRDALYETRQVREALNRDRDRVQRVLCGMDPTFDTASLEQEHPGLFVVGSEFPACGTFRELAGGAPGGDVLLADPLGNLIMRFAPDTGMRGMHRDLKKLLRVSRIG
jgi:hypothetical protein